MVQVPRVVVVAVPEMLALMAIPETRVLVETVLPEAILVTPALPVQAEIPDQVVIPETPEVQGTPETLQLL
jgi:hypothetical protein